MTKVRATLSIALAGSVLSACAVIGPGFTIPPSIPSIPPITIPSIPPITIPSIPPIELPSGFSIPSFELPSADPSGGLCALITAEEVGAIMGGTVTVAESSGTSCTYITSTFSSVIVRTEAGDLSTAKFLMGDSATDITVGPYPAVSGVFIGAPLVYIQKGGEQLVIQGVLTGEDDAAKAKILQIAQTAGARW